MPKIMLMGSYPKNETADFIIYTGPDARNNVDGASFKYPKENKNETSDLVKWLNVFRA